MSSYKIFVYGTLKRNEPNNYHLVDKNAKFVSTGITVKKWPLVIATDRNVPFLLNSNNYGKRIKGEIYEVNDETLQFLDEFECVKLNMYSRFEIEVETEEGNVEILMTYIMDNFRKEAFINENTILLNEYTEKNGLFGPYRPKLNDENFNIDDFLKQIKNNL